ncbi:WG repeat-containing protein [Phocaeicola plebeius]|uniref:WG repeat-containing protein n=1 Tax=Phocaeicola plebeius TaxID=310297 RepID=UPI0026EC207C|nr:WG repeat-containing protein [Phocaeicola plebeius]
MVRIKYVFTIVLFILSIASCGNKQSNPKDEIVEITPSFIDAVHQFDELYPFSEGMAAVRKGNKFGYINTNGELVIPCQYLYAGPYKEGFACVVKDENDTNICFIDSNGKVLQTQYLFDEGVYYVDGYIDADLISFKNGVCEINYSKENISETQVVYINKQMTEVEKPSEESDTTITNNNYEIFSVSSKDIYGDDTELKGLKDKNGKIVIPAQYNNLQLSDNGVVLATIFVEDAQSHLHPYVPYGLQINGYVDFTGKSTFSDADMGKIEGYKTAQLAAMSQLIQKEEEARLEEQRKIEEATRSKLQQPFIKYNTDSRGNVIPSQTSASHGYNITEKYPSDIQKIPSKPIRIPNGKKWVFKNLDVSNSWRTSYGHEIWVLSSDLRYINRKIKVSSYTKETFTFYEGDVICVCAKITHVENGWEKVIFNFIESNMGD